MTSDRPADRTADPVGDPDARARAVEAQLTDEERFALLVSAMGISPTLPERDERIPAGTPMSAGYTPGIARLGIPALRMSDASLGVTNPGFRDGDTATALPAGLALGASFNPALARQAGEVVGREARARTFNVQLAGGINLARDPRNGRNFEYLSEDPWLSAVLAAASIEGIQSQGVISTIKHFTLNCNETNRHWLDAVIDPAAHRESDLLAFEIAIERAEPGSVMTGYNKVNGTYAGGNRLLVQELLKDTWGFPGWVMSDWGATPSWEFALAGLDQESGIQIDRMMWGETPFVEPLRAALDSGELPRERLSEMVRRILRSAFAVGIDQWDETGPVDETPHHRIALEAARQGIVLLDNNGTLPFGAGTTARIAVIGGYAQTGVPTGTGSSAVTPPGGYASVVQIGGPGIMGSFRNLYLMPSAPFAELARAMPNAQLEYDPGMSPADAALLARRSDVCVVFAIKIEGEGYDQADLSLPWGQDAVIDAVATANPNTVVVLETGNPIAMPWRDKVAAIVQAWYPGQAGGQAIAEILTGSVNPSGRLPMTFPADLSQTPRPDLPGLGTPWGTPVTIDYHEGAEVGYRWFAQQDSRPMFAFGHGLSYTSFGYQDLEVAGGETVTASFTVTNTGDRDGADVAQLYLTGAPDGQRMRLLGFERIELAAGESRRVSITADPRLVARYDGGAGQWRIADGMHEIAVGRAADDIVLAATAELTGRLFGR